MRWHWLLFWLGAASLIGLCGCQTSTGARSKGRMTAVRGTVLNLTQAPNGGFRYYGKLRLQSPARYLGKEVELFVISHKYDPRSQVGKNISFAYLEDDLERLVEQPPVSFAIGQPEPIFFLEYTNEGLRTIDFEHYDQPVSITGVIRSYKHDNDKGTLYFQFDVCYSGDMASMEITTPAKYRGLIIHILVTDQNRNWQQIGTKVSFSVPESTLAWEPWGFTPTDWLHSLVITKPRP